MDAISNSNHSYVPWNKGKLTGQKPPLKLKEIWAIRIHLQLNKRARELALFNLAIDSKSSCVAVIWLRFASEILPMETKLRHALSSCSRNPAASPVRDHRADP